MRIYYYEFLQGGFLQLFFTNGNTQLIILDKDSGKIVTRPKVGSLSNVQHPGIRLGTDYYTGEVYVIHNHYHYGGAHIATFSAYAAGQKVQWKGGRCTNDPMYVIKIGLDHVISGKSYNWLNNNCQTLANTACHSKPVSEDVDKWLGLAAGALLVGVFVSAFSK